MKLFKGLVGALGAQLFFVTPALADISVDVCPTTEPGRTLCEFGRSSNAVSRLVQFSIIFILSAAALIALFFLIFGGVRWILSGGDKTAIENARNTIVAAIIGLVIVFVAFLLLNIAGNAFGIDLFKFNIPKI